MMPVLLLADGSPLMDAADDPLKTGQMGRRERGGSSTGARVTEVKWSVPEGFKVA